MRFDILWEKLGIYLSMKLRIEEWIWVKFSASLFVNKGWLHVLMRIVDNLKPISLLYILVKGHLSHILSFQPSVSVSIEIFS